MKNNSARPRLKRLFGLVAQDLEGTGNAVTLLSRSRTLLAPVLSLLEAGADDQAIFDRFNGIRPEEITAPRAYLCRFGVDPAEPASLPEGPKALLLDECIPYGELPFITRAFGFSSHVEAEALSRRAAAATACHRKAIDTHIAHFVLDRKFGGLLTRDTDFASLHQRAGHPAGLINIFLLAGNVPAGTLAARLTANRQKIRDALANRSADLYIL